MRLRVYERLIIALTVLMAILFVLPVKAQCVQYTGNSSYLLTKSVDVPVGTRIMALTTDGECAGEVVYQGVPLAIPMWGEDSLAATLGRSGGFQTGEQIAFLAEETMIPGKLDYRLYPYDFPFEGEAWHNDSGTYQEDAVIIANQLVPAVPLDTVQVEWVEQTIVPKDTTWTLGLRLTSPVPVGVVILELRRLPMAGDTLSIHTFIPSAQTYFAGDTLAASYIGAGSETVSWQIGGTGSGAVEIRRIRLTDRNLNEMAVEVVGEPYAVVLPQMLAGDIDRNGVVDLADVNILFVALIEDTQASLPPEADVFPYPLGDGMIDIRDFGLLIIAQYTGLWQSGFPVNP